MTANNIGINSFSEYRILNNRLKRAAELRRHIILVSLVLISSLIFVLTIFSVKSNASEDPDSIEYKHYLSVEIMPGDSISSIADEYMSSGYSSVDSLVNEILYVNNLNETTVLISGNYLIVPVYSIR
jgi:cell division protein YceG involved in septum cleavage